MPREQTLVQLVALVQGCVSSSLAIMDQHLAAYAAKWDAETRSVGVETDRLSAALKRLDEAHATKTYNQTVDREGLYVDFLVLQTESYERQLELSLSVSKLHSAGLPNTLTVFRDQQKQISVVLEEIIDAVRLFKTFDKQNSTLR